MSEDGDVERLVKRLKDLHVEQSDIIRQLETAGRIRTIDRFSPGDRVEILTRGKSTVATGASGRGTVGRVISITPKRVKVETESGNFTYRAPHNLRRVRDPNHGRSTTT